MLAAVTLPRFVMVVGGAHGDAGDVQVLLQGFPGMLVMLTVMPVVSRCWVMPVGTQVCSALRCCSMVLKVLWRPCRACS